MELQPNQFPSRTTGATRFVWKIIIPHWVTHQRQSVIWWTEYINSATHVQVAWKTSGWNMEQNTLKMKELIKTLWKDFGLELMKIEDHRCGVFSLCFISP